MISLTQADLFFASHPLAEQYLMFDAAARLAAIATAERDVNAALSSSGPAQENAEDTAAAVCEQALFLLLNPDYLTGRSHSSGQDNLSPRAKALLAPLLRERESSALGDFRFSRG